MSAKAARFLTLLWDRTIGGPSIPPVPVEDDNTANVQWDNDDVVQWDNGDTVEWDYATN